MMYAYEANLAQKLIFKGKILTRDMCYKYINFAVHLQNRKIGKHTGYYHFPNMKSMQALKDIEAVQKKFNKMENESRAAFNRFKIAVDNIFAKYGNKIVEKLSKLPDDATENRMERAVSKLFKDEVEEARELAEKYAEDVLDILKDAAKKAKEDEKKAKEAEKKDKEEDAEKEKESDKTDAAKAGIAKKFDEGYKKLFSFKRPNKED